MTAIIDQVIQPEGFEIIRDRILEILRDEITEQRVLNPSIPILQYFKDRYGLFDPSLQPCINVTLNRSNYELQSNIHSVGRHVYFIDVWTTGKANLDSGSDELSAALNYRIMGLIRAILESPFYKILGFDPGFIRRRAIDSQVLTEPQSSQNYNGSILGRVEFTVEAIDSNLPQSSREIYFVSGNQTPDGTDVTMTVSVIIIPSVITTLTGEGVLEVLSIQVGTPLNVTAELIAEGVLDAFLFLSPAYDFTPNSPSFWNGDFVLGTGSSSDLIVEILDQTIPDYRFTQPIEAQRPELTADPLLGLEAVRFTTTTLLSTNLSNLISPAEFTVFMVLRVVSTPANEPDPFRNGPLMRDTGNFWGIFAKNNGGSLEIIGQNFDGTLAGLVLPTASFGEWFLLTYTHGAGVITMSKNNDAFVTPITSGNLTNLSGITLMGGPGIQNSAVWDMRECIIHPTLLSPGDISTIKSNYTTAYNNFL